MYTPGSKSPKASDGVPGPGQYSYENLKIGSDAVKYTLKSRPNNNKGMNNLVVTLFLHLEPHEIAKKEQVPGPGQYKLFGIDSLGKYPISTVK